MGYYNMPSTKYAAELTAFEKMLRGLPLQGSAEALDVLEKMVRNIIHHPAEERFRRLRTSNEKLAPLFGLAGITEVMCHMGWQAEGEFIVLPANIKLDFQLHVVKIIEAKEHLAKEREAAAHAAAKAAKLASDPDKATLLRQVELDRQERAAYNRPANGISQQQQTGSSMSHAMLATDSISTVETSPIGARSLEIRTEVAPPQDIEDEKISDTPAIEKSSELEATSSPANACSSASANSLMNPVKFASGDVAEVVILEGCGAGNWVKCRILGPGSIACTYNVHIFETPKYNRVGGFAGQTVHDISEEHLRKSLVNQWVCHRCTLVNNMGSKHCEACGCPAPKDEEAPTSRPGPCSFDSCSIS